MYNFHLSLDAVYYFVRRQKDYPISSFIIKFPYNTRSDWLKQHALSENRQRVNDIKLALKTGFQIFALEFRQI